MKPKQSPASPHAGVAPVETAGAVDVPDGLFSGRFQSLDLLATLVAVVSADGTLLFVNAALEDALGVSRRSLAGAGLQDWFMEPQQLVHALQGAQDNEFAALRYDAWLKRIGHDPLPVHVVIAQTDSPAEVVVELLPLEQQTRQEREERLIDQAQANKELIRNLAHEIKNPLGGIRGAAQLLQMELESRELIEYTQVIIHEADRLQSLVDRLLAPHRRPHVVGDVNIHEVCERVRSLILAEFPKGLQVVRDYQSAMRANGKQEFTQGSLEAYVNMRVLAEGLERAGSDPTRAKLRSALAGIRNWALGGFVVDYSGQAPYVGSRYVDLGVLGGSGRFIG